MDELLEMLFGQAGRPLRRDLELHITRDNDGNQTIEALSASAIMLSEVGSIDQLKATQQLFHSCGCSAAIEVGGVCSEPARSAATPSYRVWISGRTRKPNNCQRRASKRFENIYNCARRPSEIQGSFADATGWADFMGSGGSLYSG